MTSLHKRRLWFVLACLFGVSLMLFLILYALNQNINLYYTPYTLQNAPQPLGHRIRMGGLVAKNSLVRGENLDLTFDIVDRQVQIRVYYHGILPDLFAENRGVVALGKLQANGSFLAEEILTKHDSTYRPGH